MDFSVQAFLLFMEKRSLSETAGILGISLESLCTLLQKLEAKWAVPLFIKDEPDWQASKEAVSIYSRILYFQQEFEENLLEMRKISGHHFPQIRIGYVYDHHTLLLQKAGQLLQSQKPALKIKIIKQDSLQILNLLRHNRLDCAVLSVDDALSSGYKQEWLFKNAMYVHFSNHLFMDEINHLEADQLYFLSQILRSGFGENGLHQHMLPVKSGYLYAQSSDEILSLLENKKGFVCSANPERLNSGLTCYALYQKNQPVYEDFYLVYKQENKRASIGMLASLFKQVL